MAVTRLSGGTTPANGSDPRTFPTIWNATADVIEANETAIDSLALTSLSGVSITSPVDNQLLTYNGTNWVNEVPAVPAVPAGSVLQVVSAIRTDSIATTSGTFTDVTGVTVTLTPVSVASKMFILVTGVVSNNNSGFATPMNIVRNGTAIGQSTGGDSANQSMVVYTASAANGSGFAASFFDSPSSVAAQTYKLQFAVGGGTGFLGRPAVNNNGPSPTVITVMEVAG